MAKTQIKRSAARYKILDTLFEQEYEKTLDLLIKSKSKKKEDKRRLKILKELYDRKDIQKVILTNYMKGCKEQYNHSMLEWYRLYQESHEQQEGLRMMKALRSKAFLGKEKTKSISG